jgi:hypothetical protein
MATHYRAIPKKRFNLSRRFEVVNKLKSRPATIGKTRFAVRHWRSRQLSTVDRSLEIRQNERYENSATGICGFLVAAVTLVCLWLIRNPPISQGGHR